MGAATGSYSRGVREQHTRVVAIYGEAFCVSEGDAGVWLDERRAVGWETLCAGSEDVNGSVCA